MQLVDANVLIYAVNSATSQHAVARRWLDGALRGTETVGFSWVALLAFIRITTRANILPNPLPIDTALSIVDGWLARPPAQVLCPGARHSEILGNLLRATGTGGNLTMDAHLAAVAIEHGAQLCTFERDFDRFPGLALQLLR